MTTTSDMARLLMMQGTQLPDAGLGPVTNTTRAGRPNPMLTASQDAPRPNDYMAPVAELLSIPMGAYGAGQLVGSGVNAAREGDYASGAGQIALGMAGMLPMAPKGGKLHYGTEHRPMTIEGGASWLHDLANPSSSFGPDIYGPNALQYFGSGDAREKAVLSILKGVRDNPDAPVTIYRGVPEGVTDINAGDWVTLDPRYASDYGNVISKQVPASHVTAWADSLAEQGYFPPEQGIRAFHGSPYDFDRFDMSKVGAGEGAQAYGHGLYFAEKEGVAKSYKDALGGKPLGPNPTGAQRYLVDGAPLDLNNPEHLAAATTRKFDSPGEAAKFLRDDYWSRWESPEAPTDMPGFAAEKSAAKALAERAAQIIEGGKLPEMKTPGHMYEVRINADPADFLDWDKPLSQQPQVARKLGFSTMSDDAINSEAFRLMDEGNKAAGRQGGWMDDPAIKARIDELQSELDNKVPNVTGANFYRGSTDDDFLHALLTSGNSLSERSAELKKAGIPGIKYLDHMSRYTPDALPDNFIANDARKFLDAANGDPDAAMKAFHQSNPHQRFATSEIDEVEKVIKAAGRKPTSNYVVFDDNLIEILRKYGLLGPVAGGGTLAGMLMGGQEGETY